MNKYFLEDRILKFNIQLVATLRAIKRNMFNLNMIEQLLRSGTSIGANYVEANGAESERDFLHKIRVAYKEARETRYWLNLLSETEPDNKVIYSELLRESDEYVKIFGKIISSLSRKLVANK